MTNSTVDLFAGAGVASAKTNYKAVLDNDTSIKDSNGKALGNGKGLVIHIPDIDIQLASKTANAKGNRVLNVYHKISPVATFSGNLIFKG